MGRNIKSYNEFINEQVEEIKTYKIIEYTPDSNWNYILQNKVEIWNFLNDGYIFAGYDKFCGCDNARSLIKNSSLIKIAYYNNVYIAISVYTSYRSGFKNVGITATTDETLRILGIDAVHTIIKNDICNYDNFFWTECSGAIEHLCEKYNGIKIPNEYVFGILQKEIKLENDGFHYIRTIKGDEQRKIIYGFNNYETFQKIKSENEEYINNCIDKILNMQIDESIEKPSFGKLSKLDTVIGIINFFIDQRVEEDCYDLPESSLNILKKYIHIADELVDSGGETSYDMNTVKHIILMGKDVLYTSSPLKISKL